VSWIAIHDRKIFKKYWLTQQILVAANERLTDMLGGKTDLKKPDPI